MIVADFRREYGIPSAGIPALGVSEFRFYLTGLSAESRFMKAIADDTPAASDEQARGALANL